MASAIFRSAKGYHKSAKNKNRYVLPLIISVLTGMAMMTEWIWHPAYSLCFAFMIIYGYLINEKEGISDGTL
jgi:hypothetical protein